MELCKPHVFLSDFEYICSVLYRNLQQDKKNRKRKRPRSSKWSTATYQEKISYGHPCRLHRWKEFLNRLKDRLECFWVIRICKKCASLTYSTTMVATCTGDRNIKYYHYSWQNKALTQSRAPRDVRLDEVKKWYNTRIQLMCRTDYLMFRDFRSVIVKSNWKNVYLAHVRLPSNCSSIWHNPLSYSIKSFPTALNADSAVISLYCGILSVTRSKLLVSAVSSGISGRLQRAQQFPVRRFQEPQPIRRKAPSPYLINDFATGYKQAVQ